MKHIFILLFLFISTHSFSQNVGIGTNSPNTSAMLDVNSSNKGFLPPRMTQTQRNNISNPAQGLMIYCTNCGTNGQAQVFDGTTWVALSGGSAVVNNTLPASPTNLVTTFVSASQISISWTDNATNEDGYKIERKTDNGNYILIAIVGANITLYTDVSISANTNYTYRVYAYNSNGNSFNYSNEISASTNTILGLWHFDRIRLVYSYNGQTASDTTINFNNGEFINFLSNGYYVFGDNSQSVIQSNRYSISNNTLRIYDSLNINVTNFQIIQLTSNNLTLFLDTTYSNGYRQIEWDYLYR